MAENDKNQASDVELEDATDKTKMRFALPQSLLMKIALGLTVLLLAAGTYFFFLADSSPNETSNEDLLIAPTTQQDADTESDATSMTTELAESQSQIMDLREQSMTLREENLQLRERIFELELEAKRKTTTQLNQAPDTAFINNYNNTNAFPPVVTDPAKPRPKPKWGEFERAQ